MKLEIVNGQLTEHFNVDELYCAQAGAMYLDADVITFIGLLERFRKWYKRPMSITSCYRSAVCNKAVGGTSDSLHLKGRAVDFPYPAEYWTMNNARKQAFLQNVRDKWVSLCRGAGCYAQVNWYDNRFHLGMDTKRYSFRDLRTKK